MPQIVVISGPGTGQTFTLPEGETLQFGNDEGSAIHIPSADIGASQGQITIRSSGTTIANLNPPVSLTVNGESVESERALNHGDMIMCADVMLLYDEEVLDDEEPIGAPAGGAAAVPDSVVEDPTIHHRQKIFEDAENLIQSLQQTSDPSRYLGSFLKVTNALVENIDLDVLLPKILDIVFEVIPADRGVVLLEENGDVAPAATKIRGLEPGAKAVVTASRTITQEVMSTKEGVLTRDAASDDRFNLGMSIVEQKIHAALSVPLTRHTGEVLGVIHLDTTSTGRTFDMDHLKLLTGIAMEATLAIVNARLVNEVGDKKRIERELEIANTIQMNLVPGKAPEVPGLELAGTMLPAKEVGGDYYDFVFSDDNKKLYIVIGDVSGKGVPAGLVMIMARCYFRPLSSGQMTTKQIMGELNRHLCKDTRADQFMTMLILEYDIESQRITYTGAGHEHLLIYRAASGEVERRQSGGVPLGMRADDKHFSQEALELSAGDSVLLYTDGVTEAHNINDEMFDLDATCDLMAKYATRPPREIVQGVFDDLQTFIDTAEQADDITLVAFTKS